MESSEGSSVDIPDGAFTFQELVLTLPSSGLSTGTPTCELSLKILIIWWLGFNRRWPKNEHSKRSM